MEPEHHWMRERMPFAVVGSNMTITDPSTGQASEQKVVTDTPLLVNIKGESLLTSSPGC